MRIGGHTLQDLIAKYEARRELLSELAANVPGATIYEDVVNDLRSLAEAIDDTPLTLMEAASESGFSRDHLARRVREGIIPNAGCPGAPRIRRANLPHKLGHKLERLGPSAYDPATDARSLVSRRKGGAHGSSQDSS